MLHTLHKAGTQLVGFIKLIWLSCAEYDLKSLASLEFCFGKGYLIHRKINKNHVTRDKK